MSDLRLTNRLTAYWNKLRGDEALPLWDRFNASSFADVWQQCCGWRVEKEGENIVYTYDYVGSSIKEALGADLTGKMFNSHLRGFPGARIVKNIDTVVHTSNVLFDEGQFINQESKMIKYRSCLLPFGNKEGKVSNIVLGLSWRAF